MRIKPDGPFGPGDTKRAIRPAMKPIMMIQMIFDKKTPHSCYDGMNRDEITWHHRPLARR